MLNVRIPRHLKAALKKAAEDDHGRSLSGMLVRILDDWFVGHGYLSPAKKQPRRRT